MTNDSLKTIRKMLSNRLRALAIRKHVNQNLTMVFKEVQYMMPGFGENLLLSTEPIIKNISQHYGYTVYLIKINLLMHLDHSVTIDDVKLQENEWIKRMMLPAKTW